MLGKKRKNQLLGAMPYVRLHGCVYVCMLANVRKNNERLILHYNKRTNEDGEFKT